MLPVQQKVNALVWILLLRSERSSSSCFLHRKNLHSLDCVRLYLDHNASRACNHNALRNLNSWHVQHEFFRARFMVSGIGILWKRTRNFGCKSAAITSWYANRMAKLAASPKVTCSDWCISQSVAAFGSFVGACVRAFCVAYARLWVRSFRARVLCVCTCAILARASACWCTQPWLRPPVTMATSTWTATRSWTTRKSSRTPHWRRTCPGPGASAPASWASLRE